MKFNYTARTKDNELQAGIVEASDRKEAVDTLQGHGLLVVSMEEEGRGLSFQIGFFSRVKNRDLVSFSRQLATLFGAKVSLVSSLELLASQTEEAYFQEIIFDVASTIEAGDSFSSALANYPKVFSNFYINMIKAGEVSGNLENTLEFLATYLEKQYNLVSKIKGALTYPAFILFGFIIVGILVLTVVIPNLTEVLTQSGQELPLPTRMIIGVSDFLIHWGWALLILLVALVFAFPVWLRKSLATRYFIDGLKLKLPIFGKIYRKFYLARMADNLATLIAGGLSILQAFQITADVVGNLVFKEIILEAKEQIRVGNPISAVFGKYEVIPPLVYQMISTGEKTGSLDYILKKISDFYTREVELVIASLAQLIEPLMIFILGAGVAILFASVLLPVYNIAGGA